MEKEEPNIKEKKNSMLVGEGVSFTFSLPSGHSIFMIASHGCLNELDHR
jgi:hypothetical protein